MSLHETLVLDPLVLARNLATKLRVYTRTRASARARALGVNGALPVLELATHHSIIRDVIPLRLLWVGLLLGELDEGGLLGALHEHKLLG